MGRPGRQQGEEAVSYNLGLCAIQITPIHESGLVEIGLIPMKGKTTLAGARPTTSCTITPKMMRELAQDLERLAGELDQHRKAADAAQKVSEEVAKIFNKLGKSQGSLGSV